ncbi:hypothetical protein DFH07DRAFT_970365 [Mycena maculata]|uniref:Uncharacterized protein n=1 Tax=Mycena maculata TaxID=230809 RepID=A0AAD7MPF0_9AGAR|nr:hypothetical protein DFH07DRAFT_970365 [Mycena maculata]
MYGVLALKVTYVQAIIGRPASFDWKCLDSNISTGAVLMDEKSLRGWEFHSIGACVEIDREDNTRINREPYTFACAFFRDNENTTIQRHQTRKELERVILISLR